ncbi:hypothetical protein AB4455_12040 [Vibrio sp. 10N.261.46.E12]|uniref:hypothetical protein n=1 Tax=unclassified Vibrio TaxID=2614977 RepID=UPI000976703F|nr:MULTISPECIES: hypothetical protein [unclassified Vibrio]OMO35717.1 hypothetical protein BH584_07430 [Vibrio sp. 10N.261.45.E1]PMJ22877.1 hypothetical protein BCU27_15960 [Vibrio sp. 10N.286.45.B6]PML87222.1 hypothetical protein BCT66_12590 [Vibrio sp. 10N.261.49.E11]PMM67518.1 hypothetical protein BCT48_14525 [Vibrio sp. 10N.261.46.F12]PMM86721.1 hypothetical protein BCT46_07685 [Vibrio sp. 10N.261.46.E8]
MKKLTNFQRFQINNFCRMCLSFIDTFKLAARIMLFWCGLELIYRITLLPQSQLSTFTLGNALELIFINAPNVFENGLYTFLVIGLLGVGVQLSNTTPHFESEGD